MSALVDAALGDTGRRTTYFKSHTNIQLAYQLDAKIPKVRKFIQFLKTVFDKNKKQEVRHTPHSLSNSKNSIYQWQTECG